MLTITDCLSLLLTKLHSNGEAVVNTAIQKYEPAVKN